jgi:hypothetical protein
MWPRLFREDLILKGFISFEALETSIVVGIPIRRC